MQEYEFTLTFNFPDPSIDPESYFDNLAQVDCDDALIGIGQKTRINTEKLRCLDVSGAVHEFSVYFSVLLKNRCLRKNS